jgi:SpoVK/Ycf46/Vps4 family AAA+-type ATPase
VLEQKLTGRVVSEKIEAPLYTLGAGDLGSTAESVEKCLSRALQLCKEWNAVLLIDEADVFLEARTNDNLARNELVSSKLYTSLVLPPLLTYPVFLRLLEYYEGILFLTTNRMDAIDLAFESRIDVIIPYEGLKSAARKQVWKAFMEKLDSSECSIRPADLDVLAEVDVDGRRIKGLVKAGLRLARYKKTPLEISHLNDVIALRKRASVVAGSRV